MASEPEEMDAAEAMLAGALACGGAVCLATKVGVGLAWREVRQHRA